MAKRLRNDEVERDSPWPLAKKLQNDDGYEEDDDILALLLLDGTIADELTALFAAESDSWSFTDAFDDGNGGEISAPTAMRVRFVENPFHASSPASVFQTTSSSYVTINGNDETCGSSFSDWDSSVMVSVDVGGLASFGGACGPRAEEIGACGVVGEGGFELDGDDVSLSKFLEEVLSSEMKQPSFG